MIYADTSFLMALLAEDRHQAEALELMKKSRGLLAITPLQELELLNAIELSVVFGMATAEAANLAAVRWKHLLGSGSCERIEPDMSRVFARARGLSVAHTRRLGARSLDILHVASAMELGVRKFRSFDERQKALAREAGLEVNE